MFVLPAKDDGNDGKPITVVYVPSHLYHMVFELFKVSVAPVLRPVLSSQIQLRSFCAPAVAERHAGHHGATRRFNGVSSHSRTGRTGKGGSDGEGEK